MRPGFKEQIGIFPDVRFGPTQDLRALDVGPESLTDYEMLEMTLLWALPRRAIKPLARALLTSFGTYSNVLAASVPELLRIKGLGEPGVAALKLVHAAALRLVQAEVRDQPVFSNWDKLMEYLNAALAREKVEQFRVLFLDCRNRLLRDEMVSRGTTNHTSVYPRQILARALELHAASLILVHNHPSGDPTPSRDDVVLTDEIRRAAASLEIQVHDHIIVGNGCWTSFRKKGLLK